jgi:putative transposase
MRNHFHLVIETPRANLVAGMKWLLGTYTARFNRRHQYFGHLFSGRYKSLIVDGSGNGYLRTVCDYVHLNPARAKLLRKDGKLADYRWSSYPAYLQPPSARPAWLRVDRVFGEAGIPKDSLAGRRELARRMEMRRWDQDEEMWKHIRRGWCFGGDEFRDELLAAVKRGNSDCIAGNEIKESEEHKAERIVKEELVRLNWIAKDLKTTPKGDKRKVRIAKRLRTETTMTLKWIAKRLNMGTWTHVANRLYHVAV